MNAVSVANRSFPDPGPRADIVELLLARPSSRSECYLRMRRAASLIRRFRLLLSRSGGDFGSRAECVPAGAGFSHERLAALVRCFESTDPLTELKRKPWLIAETGIALTELQRRRREEDYQLVASPSTKTEGPALGASVASK
jgi:hypothetical protein